MYNTVAVVDFARFESFILRSRLSLSFVLSSLLARVLVNSVGFLSFLSFFRCYSILFNSAGSDFSLI